VKPDDTREGHDPSAIVGSWFAESFVVGHNALQFRVDCGQGSEQEVRTVYFRVIADPRNAKELFRQLGLSLLRYADAYGPIDENGKPFRGER
jgi:hypothetical protein